MTEREKLEQAIAAQESLRATLGDTMVDAGIATPGLSSSEDML